MNPTIIDSLYYCRLYDLRGDTPGACPARVSSECVPVLEVGDAVLDRDALGRVQPVQQAGGRDGGRGTHFPDGVGWAEGLSTQPIRWSRPSAMPLNWPITARASGGSAVRVDGGQAAAGTGLLLLFGIRGPPHGTPPLAGEGAAGGGFHTRLSSRSALWRRTCAVGVAAPLRSGRSAAEFPGGSRTGVGARPMIGAAPNHIREDATVGEEGGGAGFDQRGICRDLLILMLI